jgi:hypothetical protein
MLVFIDKACEHGFSYEGALRELRVLYGNVRTFAFPEDIDECNLLTDVIERVEVLQHAKWRRMQA